MTRCTPRWTFVALASLSSAACTLDIDGGEIVDDGADTMQTGTGTTDDTASNSSGDGDGDSSGLVPSCELNADCGDPAQVCIADACVPATVPGCAAAGEPICGNGVLEALEECDGGPDCDAACAGFIPGAGLSSPLLLIDVAARPVGPHAALGIDNTGGSAVVMLVEDSSNPVASFPIGTRITEPRAVAIDSLGNLYAVGTLDDGATRRASVVALDAAGAERWTTSELGATTAADVAADEALVVIAGGNAQDEGSPAAVLWLLDEDGSGLAEVTPTLDYDFVSAVALTGDSIVGLGQSPGAPTKVVRWERGGIPLGFTPASLEGQPVATLHAIASDGVGGSWAAGSSDDGPLLLHLDLNGNELSRMDCLGGRQGSIRTLDVSPTGRIAMGMTLRIDDTVMAPWFGILTAGSLDFGRTPGFDAFDSADVEPGAAALVRWMPGGQLGLAFDVAGEINTRWELMFSP